jgi:hypothetical protein
MKSLARQVAALHFPEVRVDGGRRGYSVC